ncbi:MAG: restriction endonuclease subunit R, partial [Flavobacteriales bacterium]
VTNGLVHYYCMTEDDVNGKYIFLTELPDFKRR